MLVTFDMTRQAARENALMKVAEVEDFVEFLGQRDDRRPTQAATKLAQKALGKVWDNPADAAYDRL